MADSLPASFAPSRHDDTEASYRQPLSRGLRYGLLATVIFFHVGIGWALTRIDPPKIVVGDAPPMEVRMVAADPAPAPEETPPPEPEPQLESMIQPPLPDLPPPVFPVEAPPPPRPKPPTPKPPPPKPHPQQTATPVQQEAAPSQAAAAPAAPAGPKTVASSQVSFLVKPSPVYPAHSRHANEQGIATVRVLIDTTGRPAQVALQSSSGHTALDEAAISAVKAAQFRPYVEGGLPQAVWVLVPINFVLQ